MVFLRLSGQGEGLHPMFLNREKDKRQGELAPCPQGWSQDWRLRVLGSSLAHAADSWDTNDFLYGLVS